MSISGCKSRVSHRSASKWTNPPHLSEDQCRELMRQAEADPDLSDLVMVALNTGLRQGEIRILRWADIDLKHRKMTVHTPKSPETLRMIPIPETVATALAARKKRQTPKSEFVFGVCPAITIGRTTPRIRKILSSLGIQNGCFFILRRTWAARLMNAGESVTTLFRLAGWKRPKWMPLPGSTK